MSQQKKPSTLVRYGGFLLFLACTIGCFYWFAVTMTDLFSQVSTNANEIIFYRGGFYMLGAGMGFLALTFGIFYEVILKFSFTKTATKIFSYTAGTGLITLFTLPILAELVFEYYIEEKGYQNCEVHNYQWPAYRNIYYASNENVCAEVQARENRF